MFRPSGAPGTHGDGALIDVSATARQSGFCWPVALTCAAWGHCVRVPPGMSCQDDAGRLWDALAVLRWAARGTVGAARELLDSDDPEDQERLANVEELITAARQFAREEDA